MKKSGILAFALMAILLTSISVMAQETFGQQSRVRARIQTMGALGYGLAISQSDPKEFEVIKIGVAKVAVGLIEEEEETVMVGRLYFGEDKYKLKDIVITNVSLTANVYDLNDVQKGSLSLDAYPKGDKEIWAGTLTLNEKTYNVYLIQAARKIKPVEKAEKAFEYCKNNPDKCKAAMKAVGQIICDPEGNVTCREKIKMFCEQNPEDMRCKALHLGYCRFHMNDSDCRNLLMQECKKNESEEACNRLGLMYENTFKKMPGIGKNLPAWFEKVRERIRQQTQTQQQAQGEQTQNQQQTQTQQETQQGQGGRQ